MTLFEDIPPGMSADALRDALFAGRVFLSPGTRAARELAADAWAVIEDALQDAGGAATAQFELGDEAFFGRIKELRRHFYCDPAWRRAMGRVAEARGFDMSRARFDPLRLRVVMDGGHRNPKAAPVYGAHRDTWYGHPPSLITWWIPIHDAPAAQTFVFYPDCFEQPVENDSETFDYADWIKDGPDLRIGWQDIEAGRTATFPALLHRPDMRLGPEHGFACSTGDELLFAGTHLHRTLPHDAGRTRYSFDFRLVDTSDLNAGRGAPTVDNRSRGSATVDYVGVTAGRDSTSGAGF